VRTTDPTPSWLAAVGIDKHGELILRDAVRELFRMHSPMSDDEAYNAYAACGGHRTPARVRHVRLDYVRAGLIEGLDRTGRSNRNGKATLWKWVGE
jgi:hypothetical protein